MFSSSQQFMRSIGSVVVIVIVLSISGCAATRDIVQALRPDIRVKGVRLAGLSFDEADVLVDVDIANTNPLLPIALTGLDYALSINDISFLEGQQPKQLQIEPSGTTAFEIPLTLNYENLYKTFTSLKEQDIVAYQLECGLSFDLPGLGLTRIPFGTSGEIPTPRVPSIAVDGLYTKKINPFGADMELRLRMDNPNAFALFLNTFDYEFVVNGQPWAKGLNTDQVQIDSKGQAALAIPISLDFTRIGATVYQMLSGGDRVEYTFQGNLDLGTSLPLLQHTNLPMNASGSLNINR
jgi:LEA14-like dessication related protein